MPVLNISGADIFYTLKGEGRPAFVLAHGGMCDHRDWERLVPRLSQRHSVLSLDLRAHGCSTGGLATCGVERWAADINALVDALGLAPAVLVGHSLASRIVAEAAWARADCAAGVVLLDGSRTYGGHAEDVPREGQAVAATPSLAAILDATTGPHLDASARARVLTTMTAASPEAMAVCVTAMRSWDTMRADIVFPGLSAPVLAIQSTYHDRFTARRGLQGPDETTPYLDFLREAVRRLAVEGLPHTGHFSMLERPQTVAARLLAFAEAVGGPGQRGGGPHDDDTG